MTTTKNNTSYLVIVSDKDESVDETLLKESYATEAEALHRLEELATEDGWRDGLEAWAFRRSGGADLESIDSVDLK